MLPQRVYVIGGGAHGRVVVACLQDAGFVPVEVFDDDPALWGQSIFGVPLAGPVECVAERPALPAVIAMGDNASRKKWAEALRLDWLTAVHPRAAVDSRATLGVGVVVLAGSVIHVNAAIGDHALISIGACVSHDCAVGDYAHMAVGSRAAGGSSVGEGVLVGVGASLLPGTTVGPWTTVGIGSVVVRDLPGYSVATGVPARVARRGQSL